MPIPNGHGLNNRDIDMVVKLFWNGHCTLHTDVMGTGTY